MKPSLFETGLKSVTKKWTKQVKAEEWHEAARINRYDAMTCNYTVTIADAAFDVMEDAYMKASAGGTLPAHARQIYYAARPYILVEVNKTTLSSAYFTQKLLPDYIKAAQVNWDVVYDDRGHFTEPHSVNGSVGLGTINVRNYLLNVGRAVDDGPDFILGDVRVPTCGPENRFGAILFLEKEGFMPLLEKVELAERYDLAIMSTKGVSNVASRHLVDRLCGRFDIPLFVVHDFDPSGFTILSSLTQSNRRYIFTSKMQVIDLGLRLKDVQEHGLDAEGVGRRPDTYTLRQQGATEEEIEFLQSERVELNAFAGDELVKWLEGKLDEHGVQKVIPDDETLERAYRRAMLRTYPDNP